MALRPHIDSYAETARWEGVVPHLYKDSLGFATAGLGCLCKDLAQAQALTGWDRPGQVQHDWAVLRTLEKGKLPAYYRARTQARLSEAGMRYEFNRRFDIFEVQMLRNLPGLAYAPDDAYRALMDLAFNLGGGFLPKWPKLFAAAKREDWVTCAAECNRPQLPAPRNDATRALFRAAARESLSR